MLNADAPVSGARPHESYVRRQDGAGARPDRTGPGLGDPESAGGAERRPESRRGPERGSVHGGDGSERSTRPQPRLRADRASVRRVGTVLRPVVSAARTLTDLEGAESGGARRDRHGQGPGEP